MRMIHTPYWRFVAAVIALGLGSASNSHRGLARRRRGVGSTVAKPRERVDFSSNSNNVPTNNAAPPLGALPQLNSSEFAALVVLYNALGGPNWLRNQGWNTSSDPCGKPGWYGVECGGARHGNASHVVGLTLQANHLVGTLPSLARLPFLATLDLSNPSNVRGNAVTGTLKSLCGLGSLQTLSLNYNSMTGSLPACIEGWKDLADFNVVYNFIEGQTPDELCSLIHLEALGVRGNRLTGTVPTCMGEMSALRVVDYSSYGQDGSFPGPQSLEGTLPASLCSLQNLTKLQFQNTQGITGHIPECLGAEQPLLETLALVGNQLQGPIPASLCSAGSLAFLVLYDNMLTGTINSCFGELVNLQWLDFSVNSLEGSIPSTLCGLRQATELVLYENMLSGTIPNCLSQLTNMQRVELSANSLAGTIPEALCELRQMYILYLFRNRLTGAIPACFSQLTDMEDMGLQNNLLSGSIPPALCEMSQVMYLILGHNMLVGTIPSCFGQLSYMNDLELHDNLLEGTLPETLCDLQGLEFLYLFGTKLSGTIPACFGGGSSFPILQALLLHDNDLEGELPQEWSLPLLSSVTLSNNPRLHGTLPASIFTQRHSSSSGVAAGVSFSVEAPNPNLRAVVIEGTALEGTLPIEVCTARQLQTLALSGNRLRGSLPECFTSSMQGLQTLRVASNKFQGKLPKDLGNLTCLTTFDASDNDFGGTVPPGLGDLSGQLEEASIELNLLSCDLPESVRHWKPKPSKSSTVELLKGNLFGCAKGGALALHMTEAGLRGANKEDFDSYSCGGSNYVLPLGVLAVVSLLLVLLWCRGLRLTWRYELERRFVHAPASAVLDLFAASQELNRLAAGVIGGTSVAASLMLALVLRAESLYECEYTSRLTLANKRNGHSFSVGVGVSVSVGLALGLAVWLWRWLDSGSRPSGPDQGRGPAYEQLEGAESMEREAEVPPATKTKPLFRRVAELLLLSLFMTTLTVGPNVGYVEVELSDLPNTKKLEALTAITGLKTMLVVLVIPYVARRAVAELVASDRPTYQRFRLRVVMSTAIFALSTIAAPVLVVLLTDERCLYYLYNPRKETTTDVGVEYCSATTTINGATTCTQYTTAFTESTFTPSFAYNGGRCTSAVLSIYAPVFLASVLLSAALPAALEVLAVPALAPWCHRRAAGSRPAGALLTALRATTWAVPASLADAGCGGGGGLLRKADYLAERIVERGFSQLLGTLLLGLTFGVAAPAVGLSCALAAGVQLVHHQHVLGQLVGACGRHEEPFVPNLKGCSEVPWSSAAIVAATVVAVWGCASVRFMGLLGIGMGVSAVLLPSALALCAARHFFHGKREAALRARKRGGSGSSAASSKGLSLQEPMVEGGEED